MKTYTVKLVVRTEEGEKVKEMIEFFLDGVFGGGFEIVEIDAEGNNGD